MSTAAAADAAMAADICTQISTTLTSPTAAPALPLLVTSITSSARVFVHGVGREGLMLRALCMRLHHLGLPSHAVGDVTTPPIASGDLLLASGDLLLASAGPGSFPTVDAICRVAKSAGARVLLITANPRSASGCADVVVHVPARTMADGEEGEGGEGGVRLPMGSLYEGALFVLFEMVVVRLMEVLGRTEGELRARHTNLE